MHARVTHFKGDAAQIEQGIRVIKETIIPSAKKMAGFKAGYWVVDRKAGKGFGMTIFESEAAMRASEEAAKGAASRPPRRAHRSRASSGTRWSLRPETEVDCRRSKLSQRWWRSMR